MRYRLAAIAVLAASVATVPVAALTAHARTPETPAPVHVYIPYCAQAEDNCDVEYDGTRYTIRPRTPGTW